MKSLGRGRPSENVEGAMPAGVTGGALADGIELLNSFLGMFEDVFEESRRRRWVKG